MTTSQPESRLLLAGPILAIAAAIGIPLGAAEFRRGHVTAGDEISVTDPIAALSFLFLGSEEPPCLAAVDADDSGALDITDGVFLLDFLFLGGPEPSPPFHSCGADPTPDSLSCRSFPSCSDCSGGGNWVNQALCGFGVDTSFTPRNDEGDRPMDPSRSAPLGGRKSIGGRSELFVAHMTHQLSSAPASIIGAGSISEDGRIAGFQKLSPSGLRGPWDRPDSRNPDEGLTTQDATAADIDGNGMDEIVVVFIEAGSLKFEVIGDKSTGFEQTSGVIDNIPGVEDVEVVAGDFDEDTVPDLAICLSTESAAKLIIVRWRIEERRFEIKGSASLFPRGGLPGSQQRLFSSLAAGNIDRDNADELVVVLNESRLQPYPGTGQAIYWVFDDLNSGLEPLRQGAVEWRDPISGDTRIAAVADAAIGDIDGDRLGEVVIGGLAELRQDCGPFGYVLMALDDAVPRSTQEPLRSLGTRYESVGFSQECPEFDPWIIRYVHVNTLDLDGDHRAEVQANQRIFQWRKDRWEDGEDPWSLTFRSSNGETPITQVPDSAFWEPPDVGGKLNRTTSAVVVGDVNGDGRDDLIVATQWGGAVEVYGVALGDLGHIVRLGNLPATPYGPAENVKPLIAAANVDGDSTVLSYVPTEYRYAFTQPIVLAVLAAPPCQAGLQVDYECATAYGTATSNEVTTENATSVTAGVSLGIKAEAIGIGGLELKASVRAEASRAYGKEYRLEQLLVRETGPLEDGVIFTTVPYDLFTYRIINDPNPARIGTEVVVGYPRTPITTMFELRAYNNLVPEQYRIAPEGMNAFQHTPGDVCTYRSREDLLDISSARSILRSQEIDIGQGNGRVEAEINVENEQTQTESLKVEAEFEAEFTGGVVMAGFSVGGGYETSVRVATGIRTIFRGRVGNIRRAEDYPQHHYSFGLAAYARSFGLAGGGTMSFQVLDYWVRRPDACPE